MFEKAIQSEDKKKEDDPVDDNDDRLDDEKRQEVSEGKEDAGDQIGREIK